jgi:hypothetical protein
MGDSLIEIAFNLLILREGLDGAADWQMQKQMLQCQWQIEPRRGGQKP